MPCGYASGWTSRSPNCPNWRPSSAGWSRLSFWKSRRAATGGGFYDRPSADALAAAQGVGAVVSIDRLRSAEPDTAEAMEGFNDAVGRWRQEPWRGGGG